MNALVDVREIGDWYFDRQGRHAVTVHGWGCDPALLTARVTGLVWASRGTMAWTDCAAPAPDDPGTPADGARPNWCSAQLAIEVIADTPTRPARLRAAVDLTIATTIGLSRGSQLAPFPSIDPTRPGRSDLHLAATELSRFIGMPPAAPSDRWTTVCDAMLAGRGPVARWADFLGGESGPDAAGAHAPGMALHQLHNQLGLSAGDERRILGALAQSLLIASGSAERPGTVGCAGTPRAARRSRCPRFASAAVRCVQE
jgi:hypothetical protein